MANFNTISSGIWEDEKFLKLTKSSSKLFYFYSFTNPRCPISGIYKISLETMSFETGILPNCRKELDENIAVGLISYDFKKNVIWVHGKIKHDKSWTTAQREKSVCRSLEEFYDCSFISQVTIKYPFLIDRAIKLEEKRNKLAGAREPESPSSPVTEEEKEIEIEAGGSGDGRQRVW